MKALLIKVNLLISFLGLNIDPDHSSLVAVIIFVAYFIASASLFIYAQNNGWLNQSPKNTKIN